MTDSQTRKKIEQHLKKIKYAYPSGNWGRRHEGLKHTGYAWKRLK